MHPPDPTTPADTAALASRPLGRPDLDRVLRAANLTDIARLLALLSLAIAAAVIAGWCTGTNHLVALSPGLPTMKLNTAIAVTLLAVAMLALSRGGRGSMVRRWTISGCCLFAAALAIAALIDHATGGFSIVNELFARDRLTTNAADRPGLMSPAAAAGIILTAAATLWNNQRMATLLSLTSVTIAAVGAGDFLLWTGGLSALPVFSSLAVASAFSLVLLNASRLALVRRSVVIGDAPGERLRSAGAARIDLGPLRFVVPLCLGLVATVSVSVAVRTNTESEARARFERLSENLVRAAERRLNLCVYGLMGLRGVYASSDVVRREEFASYVASRDLKNEFPGVLGMGLIERVARTDSDTYLEQVRLSQDADFAIKTSGSADPMYVTRIIEPHASNRVAAGFDVGSEHQRREAIERAIDSGTPTITHPINLVQDARQRVGFLYFVPFYNKGTTPGTPEERRRDLCGVLFAPIVLEEVLIGVTGDIGGYLDFEIFDGAEPAPDAILFDLDKHLGGRSVISATDFRDRMFWSTNVIHVGGRTWTVATSTTPTFEATVDTRMVTLVAVSGSAVSVLIAFIIWSSSQARGRALSLATAMNADLQRLALVAQRTTNAVVITDAAGLVVWVNEGFTRLTGYTLAEAAGRKPGAILQCEHTDPAAVDQIRRAVRAGEGCRVELVNRGKHGNDYSLELDIQPIRDEQDRLTGFIAIESDVTERVAQRDSLRRAKEEAEAALRESTAFRATIDEHAIVSVADACGRIVDANPAFCAISGYTLKELIGKDHRLVNSGVHPKSFWVEMWRTIASGRPWRGEVCNRAKDGSLYWVDSMIAPFRDADGRIVKYVSIRTDITARKLAEEASRKSTEMLRRTGALARVGGWELDVETMRPIWSEEVYAIHELAPDTPMDVATAYEFYPAEVRHRIDGAVQSAIRDRKGFDLILPFVTAKGNKLWVRSQGEPVIENGKVTRLVGAFQNVTQEVTQKLRAEEQAERVERTVRSGGLGTWEWNCVSGEVIFNDIWSIMLGYEPGEIEGHVRSWERLVHPDDMPTVMRVLTDHMEGRTPEYRCEHRLLRKDGSWAWVLDAGMVTQWDASGRPLRAAGVHVDVTKSKELERTLSDAKLAAEAATRTKSEFLANMSHEIRTPLTAILGYADILREDGDPALAPQRRLETIDTIRAAGQHLLTVINDILDLSKIETGKMTVETIETPLVQILHEVESLMRPRARGKGVDLTTLFETTIPERVQCDPTRLRQILMNLVGNAAKFTEAGSIAISVGAHNERLRIDVDDTGPGMTPQQAASLFAPFTQADPTVTRRHGGTGLGLVISRRLAELLGGSVELVRTDPGVGSCFRLEIPLVPSPDAQHVSGFEAVSRDRRKAAEVEQRLAGRILLAEDGIDNQRLIAFHLRKMGATVDVADNGRLALELLSAPQASYNLLITDIQMPEMDGYTLARTLRERGDTIPIIALTAHAMAEDRQKCLDAGCNDYASKPIDRAVLLATCAKWMRAHPSHSSAAA